MLQLWRPPSTLFLHISEEGTLRNFSQKESEILKQSKRWSVKGARHPQCLPPSAPLGLGWNGVKLRILQYFHGERGAVFARLYPGLREAVGDEDQLFWR